MSRFSFPGRPFGSGDLPWPIALFDSAFEPPDPLFDALAEEMPVRRKGRGNGGPQGAPALAEKPRPRPPPPPRVRLRIPVAPLLILLCAGLVAAGCERSQPFAPHAGDAVLVQLSSAEATLQHEVVDEGGPPIVALASLGAEGEAPLLRVPTTVGQSPEELARELGREDAVDFAEPVFVYGAQRAPNDPRFPDQWGLVKIDADDLWEKTVGDRTVTVAIIDDGVALTHPDLAPNLWVNPDEVAGNGKDDDGDGYVDDVNGYNFVDGNGDPSPAAAGFDRWHGTHVAGIVGAAGDNGVGVAGVAWNVSLMALRALGPQGGRADDLARAIDFATDHGARIINASWLGPGKSRAIANAIARAQRHGVLFVAAAGNDSAAAPGFPASLALDNVLSVGATGPDDKLAAFSNRGALLGAPGLGILSTTAPGMYERYDGTSMAAPHVAGAAALLWAARPEASLEQVRDALLSSAVAVDGIERGRVDAIRAWVALGQGPAPAARPLLVRNELGFTAAEGRLPRAQSIAIHAEGGGALRWSASADAPWIRLMRTSGTTPDRLSIKADPGALQAGNYVGLVRVRFEGASADTATALSVSLQVGNGAKVSVLGTACSLRGGAVHVRSGTICRVTAPGLRPHTALASVEWQLPGGAVSIGAHLYGRFVRKGTYRLRVSASEGPSDEVAVVVD